MKVLQLVSTPRSFFDQQVETLERQGVECTVLSIPRGPDGGRSLVDFLRFPPAVLGRALDDFDLVHANHGLVVPTAVTQPIRPLVVTFWGSDVQETRSVAHRLVRRTSRVCATLADEVILPSPTMCDAVPGDHTVIPFAVDTDLFRPVPRDEARERVGWPDEERIVLFPYDTERAVKDYPRAEAVVDRMDVDAELRTVSGVPYEEMPYYMNASDALLVTSRRESGPMVVKEAAACNVPVVSTDVGFARDVLDGVSNSAVRDATDGLADALERLLVAGDRSDGRESLAVSNPDEVGTRIRRVYERALDDRNT